MASLKFATFRWPLLIAALVVLIDQLTKHWALNALADGHTIDIVWTLRFNLAFNTGMAFSQGAGLGPIIGVVAVVVVGVLLFSVTRGVNRLGLVAIGLVVGGALGNVVDRIFRGDGGLRGAVVDFIDLQWFPIFNVADIGVTVGGALLVLTYLLAPPDPADVEGGDDRAGTEDTAATIGVADGGDGDDDDFTGDDGGGPRT